VTNVTATARSLSSLVAGIAAGTEHALGGDLLFPGGAPIARLESWAGSVEGEVQNDDATLTLSRGALSTVVLDAAGNVLGGGHGSVFTPIPPATRVFFRISQGLRAIPMSKVGTALVSVVPSYKKPGT
jgi:hypothetical protein